MYLTDYVHYVIHTLFRDEDSLLLNGFRPTFGLIEVPCTHEGDNMPFGSRKLCPLGGGCYAFWEEDVIPFGRRMLCRGNLGL